MIVTDQHRELVREAAVWAASEFERWTRLLVEEKCPVTRIDPSARICWSDVSARYPVIGPFGLDPEIRALFQKTYEDCLRRRFLLPVLKGKMSASDWLQKISDVEPER